jgi:hypothetical protein
VRCGKCSLSTAKEIVSSVGALLKVSNLKRFFKISFRVARYQRYMLSTAKEGLLQSGALLKVLTFNS